MNRPALPLLALLPTVLGSCGTQSADLLLTNDSGALHLAAAVRCPVVAIFGATDPRITFPYPAAVGVALAGRSACRRPCFRRDCTEDHGYGEVEPAHAVEAALGLLRGKGVA